MQVPIGELEANPMIREQTDQAYGRVMDQSPQDYSQGLLQGTQMDPKFDLTNTMNDAIIRRANKGYELTQAKLGAQAQQYGQEQSTRRIAKVNQLLQDERKLNDQIKEAKQRAEMDRKAARAQQLGNILGIAGAAGGAYLGMAGGPTGAAAGAQAGAAIGGGVGGAVGGR